MLREALGRRRANRRDTVGVMGSGLLAGWKSKPFTIRTAARNRNDEIWKTSLAGGPLK